MYSVIQRSSPFEGKINELHSAWAAALALASLPFLTQLPVDYDRLAPVALLPALWLGRHCRKGDRSESNTELDSLLLGIAFFVALLSSLTGPHLAPSIVSLSSWTWIVAGALLARQFATDTRAIRALLIGITAGATLGCLSVWTLWREGISITAFPVYGHGRLFGLHMMMGTMTGLALLVQSQGPRMERLLIGLAAAITCGGMLWSGGRSGMVGIAAALIPWFWYNRAAERRRLFLCGAGVLIAGLVLSLVHWSSASYLGWWTAAARTAAASTASELSSTRLDFWKVTWNEFLKTPWIGRGADSYRYLTPKLDGDQPHNWILQFLLDFGIIGGGTLGLLLVRQAVRGFVRRGDETPLDGFRRGTAAALVACLVTGLLDGVFYHAVVLLPAAMLAGMSGALDDNSIRLTTKNAKITKERTFGVFSALSVLSAVKFRLGWVALLSSGILLCVHSYLVLHLWHSPPPDRPDALPARVLRYFPSTTLGVDGWLTHWRPQNEPVVLEWTLWAQQHSQAPARLYLYAAVIYADRDDFAAADREMELAEQTSHWTVRPNLKYMRESIRQAAVKAGVPPSKK